MQRVIFSPRNQKSAHTSSRLGTAKYDLSLTNRPGRFVVPGSIPINATTRNHYTCRRNDKQTQNKGIRTN